MELVCNYLRIEVVQPRCQTDWLSITPGSRLRLSRFPFAIDHQGDVLDRLKQQSPREAPEPTVHRLPGWEVDPATSAIHIPNEPYIGSH